MNLSNITRKMSNAERKIPSRKRIKSKMNNILVQQLQNFKFIKKASNKFSKMRNTSEVL